MAEKSESNNLGIKVNVDVSDALTGLKAVQREAKEAVKALKEVESLTSRNTLKDYSTKELHEELAKREGIREYIVNPSNGCTLNLYKLGERKSSSLHVFGPARILVNQD